MIKAANFLPRLQIYFFLFPLSPPPPSPSLATFPFPSVTLSPLPSPPLPHCSSSLTPASNTYQDPRKAFVSVRRVTKCGGLPLDWLLLALRLMDRSCMPGRPRFVIVGDISWIRKLGAMWVCHYLCKAIDKVVRVEGLGCMECEKKGTFLWKCAQIDAIKWVKPSYLEHNLILMFK